MDEKYIAYQTMVAARDSVNWAMWSMIAAWCGISVSLATLIIAKRALSTWRDQEKVKVKLDFKKSILNLKSLLIFMPELIDMVEIKEQKDAVEAKWIFEDVPLILQGIENGEINVHRYEKIILALDQCVACWLATEHLFKKSLLSTKWLEAQKTSNEYILGTAPKSKLLLELTAIATEEFVFDSK